MRWKRMHTMFNAKEPAARTGRDNSARLKLDLELFARILDHGEERRIVDDRDPVRRQSDETERRDKTGKSDIMLLGSGERTQKRQIRTIGTAASGRTPA